MHCHNRVHDKTQNLLLFSLKCHPIYPGIHKDPSIGAQTLGCLRNCNGCHGSSWNSKLAILECIRSLKYLGTESKISR